MENNKVLLSDVVEIIYATRENAKFYEINGFLGLELTLPCNEERDKAVLEEIHAEETSEERLKEADLGSNIKHHAIAKVTPEVSISDDHTTVCYKYNRVFLHRTFPYENPYEYISVMNANNEEICMIKNVEELEESDLLKAELGQMYYEPEISKINELKEHMGFTYIKAETDAGDKSITVRDIFRSITHISQKYVYITDIYGNRYTIKDVTKLDKKSYKKIELFL